MTDSIDDYDAYLGSGSVDDEELKRIDEEIDAALSKQFATLKSPSKASASRAKPPEPDEPNKSDTDEIDFPTQPQPSMSPDRTTKSSSRKPGPRKSAPGKRQSTRSNSALAERSSRCPAPKQSPVKPLLLRRLSPVKAEPLAAPASESKPPVEEVAAPVTAPPASLLKLFRPRGRLSVTDLVTPSWCEFKFDYSLRGQRWRGKDMDDVIVSKHGKAIPVQKAVVIHADAVMKQGQDVHKKLEEDLRVIEVPVKVKTYEERFALLLLNMIANFRMLIEGGTCREFHVMGFINGHYVTGIIDEINRKPAPSTISSPLSMPPLNFRSRQPQTPSPSRGKRKAKTPVEDASQRRIDSFFPASPSKRPARKTRSSDPKGSPMKVIYIDLDDDSDVEMKRASQESKEATVVGPPSSTPPEVEMRSATASQESEPPSASQSADLPRGDGLTYKLHLNDTKTRSVNSLPKDDLSGRLQLMLYHQLLGRLISAAREPSTDSTEDPSSPLSFTFDFLKLLEHLRLKRFRPFSDEFIAEATSLLDDFNAFPFSSQESSPRKSGSQSSVGSRLVKNLDDVMRCWRINVRQLGLQFDAPIDDGLELIYRMRDDPMTKSKFKGKGRTKSGDKQASHGATNPPSRLTNLDTRVSPIPETMSPEILEATEDLMLQQAILESHRTNVQDSQSSNGTVFYTPLESFSQDPDDKAPGTFDSGGDSSKAKEPEPLPTPPPSSPRTAPADATASSSTSESRAPSPRNEKDEVALQNEAVEDHYKDLMTASQGSQGSEEDWEAALETIPDEEFANLDMAAPSLSPAKKRLSQEETSKGKGKEKALPIDTVTAEPSKGKSAPISPSKQDPSIIGSKKFSFDQELLTKHIVAAIEFWESKREPRGVELEDTWKCDTCEFRDGCEWREAKAAEMARPRTHQ